jgi:hypothetical protein
MNPKLNIFPKLSEKFNFLASRSIFEGGVDFEKCDWILMFFANFYVAHALNGMGCLLVGLVCVRI